MWGKLDQIIGKVKIEIEGAANRDSGCAVRGKR